MKTVVKAVAGLSIAFGLVSQAQAAMPVQPMPLQNDAVVPVFGGCGPYGHRGFYGRCRSGGQWGGYVRRRACPFGFHLGYNGRRCWPN